MDEQSVSGPKDQGRVVYQVHRSHSGGVHQAVCPELDITAFGDTPEAAGETLRSQVAMYLEDCDGLGILDQVLIEAGFYFDGEVWLSNEVEPVKDPKIVII